MNLILITFSTACVILALEKLWPNNTLKKVSHWYPRVIFFNCLQALITFASSYLWDNWFATMPLLSLNNYLITFQVMIGYLLITFIYYWWHRMRHSISILWRFFHQFHHSPVRIEVITSFYKSPIEILANGILSSAILYILLGLSKDAVGICILITAIAELFYHMNFRTPRIIGLFFQRPEMHRIHHQRRLHHFNYSDLPIWDILFGTYKNPAVVDNETGFPNDNENKIWQLLKGRKLAS